MTTTDINTGVNLLPNRIKFSGCLEIDVNGKFVKDINTPRATAKTIWAGAVAAAKDGVKVDGVNDVAVCVHLNGLYVGTVFATKEGRKINITPDICQSAVNFLLKGIEEEKQAQKTQPTTPETETTNTTNFINELAAACNKRVKWSRKGDEVSPVVMWDNNVNIQFTPEIREIGGVVFAEIYIVNCKIWLVAIMDNGKFYLQENKDNGDIIEIINTADDIATITTAIKDIINNTTTNNDTDMNTNNTTAAPKFEELTHAATNIVLTAENDGDIYRRYVAPLIASLAKKVVKGLQLNASTLIGSSVVANIIRESLKGMKLSGWTDPVTTTDRKQAAAYLASVYISDAIENAESINA